MADSISYQEVAAAIASILTYHPQFEKVFQSFEKYHWTPCLRGLQKKNDAGATMIAERNKQTNKVGFCFLTGAEIEE